MHIAVGVIVGTIAILIIFLGVRYFKTKTQPSDSAALANKQNNGVKATDHPHQTEYEDIRAPNGEMVVNELYASADLQNPNELVPGQDAVYSTPVKKRSPKQIDAANGQEATYCMPITKEKPEMVDNVLYKSYDG